MSTLKDIEGPSGGPSSKTKLTRIIPSIVRLPLVNTAESRHPRSLTLVLLILIVGYACGEQQRNPFIAEEEAPNTTYISQVLE